MTCTVSNAAGTNDNRGAGETACVATIRQQAPLARGEVSCITTLYSLKMKLRVRGGYKGGSELYKNEAEKSNEECERERRALNQSQDGRITERRLKVTVICKAQRVKRSEKKVLDYENDVSGQACVIYNRLEMVGVVEKIRQPHYISACLSDTVPRHTTQRSVKTPHRVCGLFTPARLPPRLSGFNPRPGLTGFSRVGIVPDDAVDWRVFPGISRSPPPSPSFHSGAVPYSPQSRSSALKTSMLRAVEVSSLASLTFTSCKVVNTRASRAQGPRLCRVVDCELPAKLRQFSTPEDTKTIIFHYRQKTLKFGSSTLYVKPVHQMFISFCAPIEKGSIHVVVVLGGGGSSADETMFRSLVYHCYRGFAGLTGGLSELRRDVQGVLTSGLCVLCGLERETSSASREIQLLQPYGWYKGPHKGPSTPPALSFGNDEREKCTTAASYINAQVDLYWSQCTTKRRLGPSTVPNNIFVRCNSLPGLRGSAERTTRTRGGAISKCARIDSPATCTGWRTALGGRTSGCAHTPASSARLHHRGSKLDPRSVPRLTLKTVAPLEFRAGLEIEMKFISNRRNWQFKISSHPKFFSYLISISHFGTKIDESEIQNQKISSVQHFYIGTKIKPDPGSGLGSFDLGSGNMLVQPGIGVQWTDTGRKRTMPFVNCTLAGCSHRIPENTEAKQHRALNASNEKHRRSAQSLSRCKGYGHALTLGGVRPLLRMLALSVRSRCKGYGHALTLGGVRPLLRMLALSVRSRCKGYGHALTLGGVRPLLRMLALSVRSRCKGYGHALTLGGVRPLLRMLALSVRSQECVMSANTGRLYKELRTSIALHRMVILLENGKLGKVKGFYWPGKIRNISGSFSLKFIKHQSSHLEVEMSPTCEGVAVAERLACSLPTKANPVQSPAGSLPDFRMWGSCQTMPLVGGFSRGTPVSPTLSFRRCSILTSITLIGSEDHAVRRTIVELRPSKKSNADCSNLKINAQLNVTCTSRKWFRVLSTSFLPHFGGRNTTELWWQRRQLQPAEQRSPVWQLTFGDCDAPSRQHGKRPEEIVARQGLLSSVTLTSGRTTLNATCNASGAAEGWVTATSRACKDWPANHGALRFCGRAAPQNAQPNKREAAVAMDLMVSAKSLIEASVQCFARRGDERADAHVSVTTSSPTLLALTSYARRSDEVQGVCVRPGTHGTRRRLAPGRVHFSIAQNPAWLVGVCAAQFLSMYRLFTTLAKSVSITNAPRSCFPSQPNLFLLLNGERPDNLVGNFIVPGLKIQPLGTR
ncbi:hypothetical protein PR048_033290 [Dryococelus australis]|uniref:Ig-like domain-containing protein n=1 Tax=Dryococelus australis TaxID=614101 RepID=A0ABQ9G379_9NEOP|nr:hypothetical protein PR048_033290 [Dryococelus australis]